MSRLFGSGYAIYALGFVALILIVLLLRNQKIDFKKLATYGIVYIAIAVVATFAWDKVRKQPLGSTIRDIIQSILRPKPPISPFIYDTDPNNDDYIKRGLKAEQMYALDKILEHEKENGGTELPAFTLNALTRNDNALKAAYKRWRKCSELRRSFGHVVYPSERHLLHYFDSKR